MVFTGHQMRSTISGLAFSLACVVISLSCGFGFSQDGWGEVARRVEGVSRAGGVVLDPVGEVSEGFREGGKKFDDWLKSRDPGVRLNKDIKRTGKEFGEGVIEGLMPGIDLVVDGAIPKFRQLSKDINADVLGTGNALIANLENATDRVVVSAIKGVNSSVHKALQDASVLIKDAMDRQAEIADNSLLRIEAAISDQVPFTASSVFAQAEALILTLSVAGLLLGAIAFYLKEDGTFKRAMKDPLNWKGMWQRSVESISIGSRVIMRFGPPLVVSALLVHLLYWWHYTSSQSRLLATLSAAAENASVSGDFKTAASYRMRLTRLSSDRKYAYEFKRDAFLTKYYQGNKKPGNDEIYAHFWELLDSDQTAELLPNDLESVCLIFYEASKSPETYKGFVNSVMGFASEEGMGKSFREYLDLLRDRLVGMKKDGKRLPFGGKFVFLASLRQSLQSSNDVSVENRLRDAEKIGQQLLECYPRYPAGLKAVSMIAYYRLQGEALRPYPDNTIDDELKNEMNVVRKFADFATILDPAFSELVSIEREFAPSEVIKKFMDLEKLTKPTAGDTFTSTAAGVDAEIDKLKKDPVFVDYMKGVYRRTSVVYGSGSISLSLAEKCTLQSIDRGMKVSHMMQEIDTANNKLKDALQATNVSKYEACILAAQRAHDANQHYVAELWLKKAASIDLGDEGGRSDETVKKIQEGIGADLAHAVCSFLE